MKIEKKNVESFAKEFINRGERFIEEEYCWVIDERTCDRRPHLHSPRKLTRELVSCILKTNFAKYAID